MQYTTSKVLIIVDPLYGNVTDQKASSEMNMEL